MTSYSFFLRIFGFVTLLLGAHTLHAQTAIQTHDQSDFSVLIDAINQVRNCGTVCARQKMKPVQPIRWNDKLAEAAAIHASDLAKNQFFSHRGSDGSNPSHRADRVGYNWQSVSENIAKGPRSEQDVVKGWLNSPDHCKTIMMPQVNEMGVARNGSYWVQVFGLEMPE